MIQGERRLSTEERIKRIFNRVSEYDIYRFYLGDFPLNEPFCNPLRNDSHPSMDVREMNIGRLMHHDYGDDRYRGGCIDLVMQKYFCDLPAAVGQIERDFNIDQTGKGMKPTVVTWETPTIIAKPPPKIHVSTRKPTNEELRWWSDRLQDISDLKREHIYFPRDIYRNHQRLPDSGLLTICYYYPDVDKWKIYRPDAGKRQKDTPPHKWKWDTNLSASYCENLEAVRGATKGLLVAKKKDRLYLQKLLEVDEICNVQAEDPVFVSDEVLEVLKNIPDRWASGDNDKKGKEFSWWLTGQGFKHINVPDELYDDRAITDWVDWGVKVDHKYVYNHFKNKGFI